MALPVDAENLSDASPVNPSEGGLLVPGRNCWRVEQTDRASVLVDGCDYFRHLEDALHKARRSIQIIGWDFDSRIRLRQDLSEEVSPPLGTLLRQLVERHRDLRVDILVWSLSLLHAPGETLPLLFGAEWQDHPRIRVKLDTFHPFYAAHHQKIVCIDEKLAFVGGIDLTVQRWDTPEHLVDDPRRLDPDGEPYAPVHDLQMVVDGDPAEALCRIVQERHAKAGMDDAAPKTCGPEPERDLWPEGLLPAFRDTPVAIARSEPSYRGRAEVHEAQTLNLDAIASAQRSIYIEAQYMTAKSIGKAIARRLAEQDGPEVVVVMTHESHGLLERIVMGSNRDRLIRRLDKADRQGRLRILFPVVPASEGEKQVLVHSKLFIVDDRFIRIGSSNLNNRSIALDTECDLAVEASDPERRLAIATVRNRLLAEHLDCAPQAVADEIARSGSLISAVDRLNVQPRGLRPFEALRDKGSDEPTFATSVLDPKRPFGVSS